MFYRIQEVENKVVEERAVVMVTPNRETVGHGSVHKNFRLILTTKAELLFIRQHNSSTAEAQG